MKKYTQKMVDKLIQNVDGQKIIANLDFSDCDLSFLNFTKIKFIGIKVNYNTNFSGANLSEADFSGANLIGANFRGADFSGANFSGANLSGANFSKANLSNANLSEANFSGADFSGANFSGANFSGADLKWAIGNMKSIYSMQLDTWTITFTKDILCIGCKQYPHDTWCNFTDDEISTMDDKALEWWQKWKTHIFKTIDLTLS